MKFDNERDWLLDRLTKIPALGTLLKDSTIEESLVLDDEPERVVLPYGGSPTHRGDAWKKVADNS